jgi:hypothetical protein
MGAVAHAEIFSSLLVMCLVEHPCSGGVQESDETSCGRWRSAILQPAHPDHRDKLRFNARKAGLLH